MIQGWTRRHVQNAAEVVEAFKPHELGCTRSIHDPIGTVLDGLDLPLGGVLMLIMWLGSRLFDLIQSLNLFPRF